MLLLIPLLHDLGCSVRLGIGIILIAPFHPRQVEDLETMPCSVLRHLCRVRIEGVETAD